MPNLRKEYHLVDFLTGESLGGFVSLAEARDEGGWSHALGYLSATYRAA